MKRYRNCIGQDDGRHYPRRVGTAHQSPRRQWWAVPTLPFVAWIYRAKVSIILLTITKRYRNLTWLVVLLSGLFIIIGSGATEAQEETHIRGRIAFDFPKTPEAKIEINLSGKLISLVAKAAKHDRETAALLEMLEGVYVRGYHSDDADLDEINRYYENKLKEEGWDVIAKVKGDDETVEVRTLSDQDIVNGLFIMVAGDEETILLNIFGRINPERIGELLDSLDVDDLGDFDVDLDDLDLGFDLDLSKSDEDYEPRRHRRQARKREFAEELDWTLDGAGVSVISAETTNGAITVDGSVRDQVIVHAFKEVRARNEEDAEEFAKKVHVHVERRGNEIKIYTKYPKPPRGVSVTVAYEIQCPSAVDINLHTTNGKIESSGVDGAIDAATTNGKIELHGGSGRIHAASTNGKIEASVGRIEHEAQFVTTNGSIDVEIREGVAPVLVITTNGSIDLKLPGDFSGQLDAKTNNGRVRSDFPVPYTDKSKKRMSGQIGEGGSANVKLRTANGSINLRKW